MTSQPGGHIGPPPSPPTAALRPYSLADNLDATHGVVFLTGTQALVRLLLMQRALDVARGLATAGFVSGYRGSPLGMVDQQLWKAKALLDAAGVQFLPAINEDLAATACLGTQRVATDPQRTVEGVFAMTKSTIEQSLIAPHLLSFGAPILMYVLLARISGVPPLEAHMKRSRPEAFAAYTARVSEFWPRPPCP